MCRASSSFLLLLALAFAVGPLRAQEDATSRPETPTAAAREAPVFTLYFENDYFGGTDRHYTNGLKLAWLSADRSGWNQDGWKQNAVEALPLVGRAEGQKNIGFALGQNMYTPQDNDTFTPDPNDRPYAGWTYLELSFLNKTTAVADIFAIQVGIVGPHSYAGEVQEWVHGWTDNPPSNGWDHQLHDEVGVNLVFERRWRVFARTLNGGVGIDFVPHAGVSLGNILTAANVGGTVRFGFHLPSDFGVQLIRPGGGANSPTDDLDPRVTARNRWSLFFFGAADGRAVARDIFLDGNTFRDSPSVKKERYVADLSYGIGLIKGAWQLTFTQVWRTREFQTQPNKYNRFGSVTLSRAF